MYKVAVVKRFYVREIADVNLSKLYFWKNGKKTCKPNNHDLNPNWIIWKYFTKCLLQKMLCKTELPLRKLGTCIACLKWNTNFIYIFILYKCTYFSHPFRRFSALLWQNAGVNNIRRAMVCNAYFVFLKFIISLKRLCA